MEKNKIGAVSWFDLTVDNAEEVRDFYSNVTGWTFSNQEMSIENGNGKDKYEDYCMNLPHDGTTVAGICHAKGSNSNIPPQWMMYISVEDIERSVMICLKKGGKIMDGPRKMGNMNFCVIQDPAGACCALVEG
ncbi:hypothetical protein BH10BAC5_BH10BAC5_02710 [soil metagenome]